MSTKALHSCLLVVLLVVAHAAAQDTECRDVLAYAGRNVTVEEYSSTVAKKASDELCDQSQMKNNLNITAGVQAVVKAIPAKFNLGFGSETDKIQNFCRQFHQEYSANVNSQVYNSTVVADAVRVWGDCVNSRDVQFYPKFLPTQVTIGLKRKTPNAVTVQGVHYDNTLLTCTAPNSDSSNAPVTADRNIKKGLDANYWTVICDRRPATLADGTKSYPQVDITVTTTGDNLSLTIPKEANMPTTWASQFETRMGVLEQRFNSSNIECQTSERTSGVMHYPFVQADIPPALQATGGWFVTGGSCRLTDYDNPQNRESPGDANNNEPITVSRMFSTGWFCKAGDPPNMGQSTRVTAQVVYCRLKK